MPFTFLRNFNSKLHTSFLVFVLHFTTQTHTHTHMQACTYIQGNVHMCRAEFRQVTTVVTSALFGPTTDSTHRTWDILNSSTDRHGDSPAARPAIISDFGHLPFWMFGDFLAGPKKHYALQRRFDRKERPRRPE